MPILNPPADLDFPGSTLILTEQMTFPEHPRNGNFAFVNGSLHIYGSADNVTTWYPLTNRNQYYIHIQQTAAVTWDIVHNLNTVNIIHMSYDTDGLTLDSVPTMVSPDEMKLTFSEAKSGTVIFFITSEAQLYALEQIVNLKADKLDVYTRAEISQLIADQLDPSELIDVDAVSLEGHPAADFALVVDTYNKTEVAALISGASNVAIDATTLETHSASYFAVATDTYTKAEVSGILNGSGGLAIDASTLQGYPASSFVKTSDDAPTATKLATARTIDITGDIVATAVAFDGTANIAISASVTNDSHSHTGSTISSLSAANTTTGVFAAERIPTFAANVSSAAFPIITGSNGIMEIGRYLDFHTTGSATDYDMRLDCSTANQLQISGGSVLVNGDVQSTGNVTAYYSDARLKDFSGVIPDAIDKIKAINGYYFTENETAKALGYDNPERQVGVSAQEVLEVMPEVIAEAPIDPQYMTVQYDKLVPLLIQAVKELTARVESLEASAAVLK